MTGMLGDLVYPILQLRKQTLKSKVKNDTVTFKKFFRNQSTNSEDHVRLNYAN
jgi:hypothetical protein